MISAYPTGASRSTSSSGDLGVPWRNVDWILLVITVLIVGTGVVALWSQQTARQLDPATLLNRQGVAIALGGLGMFIVMGIGYRSLRPWAPFIYGAACVLLVLVRVAGTEVNGARAWFSFGPLQLQPSELAKVALIFMLAAYLAEDRGERLPYDRFVKSLFMLFVPMGLVLLQPDLGTASTMVAIAMGVLLIARAPVRHIALISILSVVTAVALVSSGALQSYQRERLTSFIDQKETADNKDLIRQQKYSKQAITLGRIGGAGFGQGITTSKGEVPAQETDFIFSAIAEQFGLLGAGTVLILYLFMLLRCIRIAQLSPDHMGSLIAIGAATLLTWHIFENVGMNLGIMPITGIPLPLISYGGSSMIAFLGALGLVQSVHMRRYSHD